MALVDLSTRPAAANSLFAALSNFASDLYQAHLVRQTRKELARLDERGLEDIGLNRADIDTLTLSLIRAA